MDPLKESISESLDKSVFQDLELNDINKRQFIENIESKANKSIRRKKYFSLFTVGVAGVGVLLITLLLSMPFIDQFLNKTAAIQSEISKDFGHEVVIPDFEDYPITFAALYDPKDFPPSKQLSISYSKNKEGKDPRLDDQEEISKWEKEQESKLYYGEYLGKRILNLSYRTGNVELDDEKIKTVNGIKLQYDIFTRDAGTFYIVEINVKKGFYSLDFTLDEEFTEQDADRLLDEFTLKLNRK
jgi:hypothetical protein